jgi:hypothetical protein
MSLLQLLSRYFLVWCLARDVKFLTNRNVIQCVGVTLHALFMRKFLKKMKRRDDNLYSLRLCILRIPKVFFTRFQLMYIYGYPYENRSTNIQISDYH